MRLLADRLRQRPGGQEFIDSWKAKVAPTLNTVFSAIRTKAGGGSGTGPGIFTGTVVDPNGSYWDRIRSGTR